MFLKNQTERQLQRERCVGGAHLLPAGAHLHTCTRSLWYTTRPRDAADARCGYDSQAKKLGFDDSTVHQIETSEAEIHVLPGAADEGVPGKTPRTSTRQKQQRSRMSRTRQGHCALLRLRVGLCLVSSVACRTIMLTGRYPHFSPLRTGDVAGNGHQSGGISFYPTYKI